MAVGRCALMEGERARWPLKGLSSLGCERDCGALGVKGLLDGFPDGVMSYGGTGTGVACGGESSSIVRGPLSAEKIEGMVVE